MQDEYQVMLSQFIVDEYIIEGGYCLGPLFFNLSVGVGVSVVVLITEDLCN